MPKSTFLLDGLDECVAIENQRIACDAYTPRQFLGLLRQAVKGTAARIMIIGRDEPDIGSGFEETVDISANENRNELRICADNV